MNATRFLYAAYLATWVIHASYLASLVWRFRRARQRMRELEKQK